MNTGKRKGIVQASGTAGIEAGGHCESSALGNALRAVGYRVAECDIIGGGGAPSFMFSAEGFPFLGGRSEKMRERFFEAGAIPYRAVAPDGDAWTPVFDLLEKGIPVPLRVDMRFLPYLYGGRFGPAYMSFGWHWITLFAVDFDRGVASVSDTGHAALKEIRLADLDKARRSKTKVWPPRAEYVELRPPTAAPFVPDRLALVRSAVETTIANYEGRDAWDRTPDDASPTSSSAASASAASSAPPDRKHQLPIPTGLAGLEAFPDLLRSFDRCAKPWIVAPAMSLLAGCIERNGTGGGAFRVLFREFVERSAAELDAAGNSDASRLRALLPALDPAIAAWRALAAEFDAAGASIKAGTKPPARAAVYEKCAARAELLAVAEKRVYEALKAY